MRGKLCRLIRGNLHTATSSFHWSVGTITFISVTLSLVDLGDAAFIIKAHLCLALQAFTLSPRTFSYTTISCVSLPPNQEENNKPITIEKGIILMADFRLPDICSSKQQKQSLIVV